MAIFKEEYLGQCGLGTKTTSGVQWSNLLKQIVLY